MVDAIARVSFRHWSTRLKSSLGRFSPGTWESLSSSPGMLLADRVFSEHRRSLERAAALYASGISVRRIGLMGRDTFIGEGDVIQMPSGPARDRGVNEAYRLLLAPSPVDFAASVARVLRANTEADDRLRFWLEGATTHCRTASREWLLVGLYLGILGQSPLTVIEDLVGSSEIDAELVSILLAGDLSDYLEANDARLSDAIKCILNGDVEIGFPWSARTSYLTTMGLLL